YRNVILPDASVCRGNFRRIRTYTNRTAKDPPDEGVGRAGQTICRRIAKDDRASRIIRPSTPDAKRRRRYRTCRSRKARLVRKDDHLIYRPRLPDGNVKVIRAPK